MSAVQLENIAQFDTLENWECAKYESIVGEVLQTVTFRLCKRVGTLVASSERNAVCLEGR